MRNVLLIVAILIFAIGNLLFAVPNYIMNGGITGLSQLSYYIFHTNIGLSLLLFNLPLFIYAFFKYRDLFYKSVASMIVFSLAVGLLQNFIIPFGIQNIWIGSIVGGFWMGISLGILAKLNASLGGGSLLGKMLNLRYGFSLSKSIFFIDASVYPLSLFIIGGRETLFSLILTAFSAFGVYVVGLLSNRIPAKDNKPSFQ
ncbi:YitT family protein [Paenibacillus naphthalenovorans]|uniref:YitT family protein n=1 Tax=Paenibacillus naphthalenovorans TaxID=162209 RepID=UPI0010BAA173|nr:YitT family protein [Paenibacillus naphthalenovorans]GCL70204.1 YitT family protein [Paenibacillus naphthalenovorans]